MRTQHLVVGFIAILLIASPIGVVFAQTIASTYSADAYGMPPGAGHGSVPSLAVQPAAMYFQSGADPAAPQLVTRSPSDRLDFGTPSRPSYSNPSDSYPSTGPSWLLNDLASIYPLWQGWEIEAGGFYMERLAPNGDNIQILSPIGGAVLFDPGSLVMDWAGGVRAEATKQLDYQGRRHLNIAYMGSDAWEYHETFGSFVGTVNGVGQFGGGNLTIDSSARLYSAEANLVTDLGPHFSVLAGYRWVETGDNIMARTIFAGEPPVATGFWVDAINHMHGFQVGAIGKDLWGWRNVRLSADVKAGVFSDWPS